MEAMPTNPPKWSSAHKQKFEGEAADLLAGKTRDDYAWAEFVLSH